MEEKTTLDLITWLRRETDTVIDNLNYKGRDGNVYAGVEKHGHGFYDMPIPRWDLRPRKGYSFPFSVEDLSERRKELWAFLFVKVGMSDGYAIENR